MHTKTDQTGRDTFKILLRILYAVSLTIYVYFVIDGLQYYQTPYIERPHHEQYRELRPAGFTGHGFGVIGTLMMLFMLLYSIRKRTRWFGEWGSINRWLDIHIYFGVMGPLFVILHTSFKVNGLIAISFWSMIAVATSGILGRYLYLQIPRNNQGNELSLSQIEDRVSEFNLELQEQLLLSDEQLVRMESMNSISINERHGIVRTLMAMIFQDMFAPLRWRRLRKAFANEFNLSGSQLKTAIVLVRKKILVQRRILFLNQVQQVFHFWHVFHKPFAIIMYVIMFVHIGVAIWLGYTWII